MLKWKVSEVIHGLGTMGFEGGDGGMSRIGTEG
jgi:hypothetical protein